MNDDIRKAIETDKDFEILEIAKKHGFQPFEDDAKEKIKKGITTVEEVLRVLKL